MADEESPFQSWSRRLIFGPMPLVQQRLQERAKRAEDEYAAEQQGIRDERTAGRQRENILLNIQEQARVQREKEDREKADAAARLKGLTEALKPKPSLPALGIMQGSEGATSVPVPMPPRQPTMEDVIPHLTEKGRESMLEKRFAPERPDVFKGVPPEHDIVSGRTGEITRPGTPKPVKSWMENFNILNEGSVVRAALERKARLAQTGGPALTSDEQEKLDILTDAAKKYETMAGGIAGEREKGKFTEEQKQPIAEKASQYIHPEKYVTPSPDTARGEVEKGYRHIPTASNPGRGVVTVWQLLSKASDIIDRRDDLFYKMTGNDALDIVQRAKVKARWLTKDIAGDPDIAELKSLMAAIPQMVRSFGDTGNIAFAEREMTSEATGLSGPNSKIASLGRLKALLDLTNAGMGFYGLSPLKIPKLDKALEGLKKGKAGPGKWNE